jgi:acyl-CoA thioesterase-1
VRVATDGSCRALAAILDEADALGFPAFVIGPAPVDDAEQNLRISALSRSFAEVCQERGRPFVEAVGPLCESSVWMAEVSAGDGAHPQTGGYEAIADLLIQAGLLAWITGPIATGTPTGHASAQVRGGARV